MSRAEASKTRPLCLTHSILDLSRIRVECWNPGQGLSPLQRMTFELFRVRSIRIRGNQEASPWSRGRWGLMQNHQWGGTYSSSPCREVWAQETRHLSGKTGDLCQVGWLQGLEQPMDVNNTQDLQVAPIHTPRPDSSQLYPRGAHQMSPGKHLPNAVINYPLSL